MNGKMLGLVTYLVIPVDGRNLKNQLIGTVCLFPVVYMVCFIPCFLPPTDLAIYNT